MNAFSSRAGVHVAFVFATGGLALAACTPLSQLDDGRLSAMSPGNTAARLGLVVRAPASPVHLAYRAVKSCSYVESGIPVAGQPDERRLTLTMRAIGDRIQAVFIRGSAAPDTLLLGRDGHLFDFNAASSTAPEQRRTSETEGAIAQEQIERTKAANPLAREVHSINEFTIYLPEYGNAAMRPGDLVATVNQEDHTPFATYRFMGVTTYHGAPAAVLDVSRLIPGLASRGPIVVGFDVVDLRTSLPLLLVGDNGPAHLRLEQSGCSI